LKRAKITINKSFDIASLLKTNFNKNIFFCTFYNIENKHESFSKIKFGTDELSAINIIAYQILSLILLMNQESRNAP
jgi:hypothetical protein